MLAETYGSSLPGAPSPAQYCREGEDSEGGRVNFSMVNQDSKKSVILKS